jgi:hypothetical protein
MNSAISSTKPISKKKDTVKPVKKEKEAEKKALAKEMKNLPKVSHKQPLKKEKISVTKAVKKEAKVSASKDTHKMAGPIEKSTVFRATKVIKPVAVKKAAPAPAPKAKKSDSKALKVKAAAKSKHTAEVFKHSEKKLAKEKEDAAMLKALIKKNKKTQGAALAL